MEEVIKHYPCKAIPIIVYTGVDHVAMTSIFGIPFYQRVGSLRRLFGFSWVAKDE